jgi:hypothetical protein
VSEAEATARAWNPIRHGLGFARRGGALAAVGGLLTLLLSASARAGCASEHLPEVQSLMSYQSVIFHGALLLGLVLAVGGLARAALLPGSPIGRVVGLAVAGVAAAGLVLAAAASAPGTLPAVDAPLRRGLPLLAALVGTTGLGAAVLVAALALRQLGDAGVVKRAALFGVGLLLALLANAEATAGWLYPGPVAALEALGAIALVDVVILWWWSALLRGAEARIRDHVAARASAGALSIDPASQSAQAAR